jgi:hypothetical protein
VVLAHEIHELGPGGMEAQFGGGVFGHRQRIAGESAATYSLTTVPQLGGQLFRGPRAMPSGTAASIGRVLLHTGIRHSGTSTIR